MTLLNKTEGFQKPAMICQFLPKVLFINTVPREKQWHNTAKTLIQTKLMGLGLSIRKAIVADISAIQNILDVTYSKEHRHYRAYSLFETLQFGDVSIVLLNEAKEIVGLSINTGYADSAKSLFTSFTVILPTYNGMNLGADLSRYAAILGFEVGLKVKRNTANPSNIPALINLLNYVGCTIDGFHRDLYKKGLHQYTMTLPLTQMGLSNNRIDLKKTMFFISNSVENIDYKLLNCTDLKSIETIYKHTDFKIVAILPEQWTNKPHQFLALPKNALINVEFI